MTDSRRAAEAALRIVAGVPDIQVVGALPDEVVELLGISSRARSVWVHHETVRHIYNRRGLTRADADFVLEHMVSTILRPHYCGPDPGDHRRIAVVRETTASRFVCIPLKFVPAASAKSETDEVWVSTGFPLGDRFLTKGRWKHKFHRVLGTTD